MEQLFQTKGLLNINGMEIATGPWDPSALFQQDGQLEEGQSKEHLGNRPHSTLRLQSLPIEPDIVQT